VGKSRARNPTQNPTQKPTPNRPEPGRTIQRLRTAPCPQALRSARDAWRAHGPSSEETAQTVLIKVKIKKKKPTQLSSLKGRFFTFIRTVLSRTPLIIRTVDQKGSYCWRAVAAAHCNALGLPSFDFGRPGKLKLSPSPADKAEAEAHEKCGR